MNENNHHDKALENAIERVVHGKKASGNELFDTLGNAKPKADPEFMTNLEERLMAELSNTKKENTMAKRKEIPGKFGRWPLTMAAAIIAILLIGGLALFMRQKPMELGNQAESIATATQIPMVPVVIAIQDIPEGRQITADMVAVILFPAETTPQGAFASYEDVVGFVTATTIYQEEIVLARKLLEHDSVYVLQMTQEAQVDQHVPVVIAVSDIPAGRQIERSMLAVVMRHPDTLPIGAISSIDDVIGTSALRAISYQEVITEGKLDATRFDLTATAIVAGATEQANTAPFSLTATAIIAYATGTANAVMATPEAQPLNPSNAVPVIFNAPNPQGCDAGTSLAIPLNGQVISSPIIVRAMANHNDFAQAKIEISGPSTNNQFVVIANINQVVSTMSDVGQFVPALYTDGTYQFRLQTFSTLNHLVATCTITIYISNEAAQGNENIGILVGHQGFPDDRGSVCENGLSELEINQEVASSLQSRLQNEGYTVTMLNESNPTATGLDLTILLHTASCDASVGSGYRLSLPEADYTLELTQCTTMHYGLHSGLGRLANIPLDEMPASFGQTSPTILIEMGSLYADQQLLDHEQSRIVQGLTNSIECFFGHNLSVGENSDLTPVVMALQDIPINTVITEDMVSLVYWPVETMEEYTSENNGQWFVSRLEDVIGMESNALIPTFSPISSDWYTEPDGCTEANIASAPCTVTLPAGYVALIIHTPDLSAANFVNGQHVDIIASMLFVGEGESFQVLPEGTSPIMEGEALEGINTDNPFEGLETGNGTLIMQRVIVDAIVQRTELLHPGEGEEVFVLLALKPQDAVTLAWLDEADIQYMLVPHLEGTYEPISISRSTTGLQAVTIPLDDIQSLEYGIAEGDTLEILISPSSESLTRVPVSEGELIVWRNVEDLETVITIPNIRVLEIGGDGSESFITLETSSGNAWLLDWYLSNGVDFTLRRTN